MELYNIKRVIKRNKYIYILLKIVYKPIKIINKLFLSIYSYKVYKNVKKLKKEDKKILYIGVPLHSNLGDQAQYMCIKKWLFNNYPDYKIIEYPDCLVNSTFFSYNKLLKKIINSDDFIVFQSGYRTSDVANFAGEKAQRKIVKLFKNNKVLVFPQTINFKSQKELEKSIQIYNENNNVLLLVRDKKSYEYSKLYNVRKKLFPDIVTSLIGTYNTNLKRSGIILCLRRDAEKFYEDSQLDRMADSLKNIDLLSKTDTTIDQKYSHIKNDFENLIYEKIKTFSNSRVVITDRYHGIIFSLISNTPTIVLKTNDHKVSSGIDFFKDSNLFSKHLFIASSLEQAIQYVENIYENGFDYGRKLPTYFYDNYYSKLKKIFECEDGNESM